MTNRQRPRSGSAAGAGPLRRARAAWVRGVILVETFVRETADQGGAGAVEKRDVGGGQGDRQLLPLDLGLGASLPDRLFELPDCLRA